LCFKGKKFNRKHDAAYIGVVIFVDNSKDQGKESARQAECCNVIAAGSHDFDEILPILTWFINST